MRFKRPVVLALVLFTVTASIVLAAPVKLTSTPLARGTWDRADRTDFLNALGGQGGMAASDVFIVRATLGPADATDTRPGSTDWHTHTGPSVVIVTQGELTVTMPMQNGTCMTETVVPGQAFSHATSPHNFVNNGTTTAEFYVAYFVPAGPVLVPAENPGC